MARLSHRACRKETSRRVIDMLSAIDIHDQLYCSCGRRRLRLFSSDSLLNSVFIFTRFELGTCHIGFILNHLKNIFSECYHCISYSKLFSFLLNNLQITVTSEIFISTLFHFNLSTSFYSQSISQRQPLAWTLDSLPNLEAYKYHPFDLLLLF